MRTLIPLLLVLTGCSAVPRAYFTPSEPPEPLKHLCRAKADLAVQSRPYQPAGEWGYEFKLWQSAYAVCMAERGYHVTFR